MTGSARAEEVIYPGEGNRRLERRAHDSGGPGNMAGYGVRHGNSTQFSQAPLMAVAPSQCVANRDVLVVPGTKTGGCASFHVWGSSGRPRFPDFCAIVRSMLGYTVPLSIRSCF